MSMSRVTAILAVLCIGWACAMPAAAQHELHNVPPVINPDGDNPDLLQPFVDPLAFNPDFQFFAPAEVDNYGDGPEANTGWFATYDRMYLYVSRPNYVPSYTEGDFAWGNRFDLGYMSDEEHGWLFSFTHLDGPNAIDDLVQERINVYQPLDEIFGAPGDVILRGGGDSTPDTTPRTFGLPVEDRNSPVTNQRDYILEDYLNVATLQSWELNKTLRLNQKHYGSWFEPFAGFRYMVFSSDSNRDRYLRYDEETALPVPVVLPVPTADAQAATIEQMIRDSSNWTNRMVGGQLGFRWFKQKSHWLLSTDVRAFACQNFQSFHSLERVVTTYYDGADIGADVLLEAKAERGTVGHNAEFVVGGEVRVEAAYAVSKAISIRGGAEFMEFGTGVARGRTVIDNTESVTMIGWTFGATLNR